MNNERIAIEYTVRTQKSIWSTNDLEEMCREISRLAATGVSYTVKETIKRFVPATETERGHWETAN